MAAAMATTTWRLAVRQVECMPAITLLLLDRRESPNGRPAGQLLVAQMQVQRELAGGVNNSTFYAHIRTASECRATPAERVRVHCTPVELQMLKDFGVAGGGAKDAVLLSLALASKALDALGMLTTTLQRQLTRTSTDGLQRAVPFWQLQQQQLQLARRSALTPLYECTRPFSYSGECCSAGSAQLHSLHVPTACRHVWGWQHAMPTDMQLTMSAR